MMAKRKRTPSDRSDHSKPNERKNSKNTHTLTPTSYSIRCQLWTTCVLRPLVRWQQRGIRTSGLKMPRLASYPRHARVHRRRFDFERSQSRLRRPLWWSLRANDNNLEEEMYDISIVRRHAVAKERVGATSTRDGYDRMNINFMNTVVF